MMITFHSVSWTEYFSDPARSALWAEHYEEFWPVHQGRIPMNPDRNFYEFCEAAGMLEVLVARAAGEMVGYVLATVKPHPHYGVLCGFEDSYFLSAKHRGGRIGIQMIQRMNEICRRRGCKRVFWMTKKFKDLSRIFASLGAEHTDEVWAFWLDEEGEPG